MLDQFINEHKHSLKVKLARLNRLARKLKLGGVGRRVVALSTTIENALSFSTLSSELLFELQEELGDLISVLLETLFQGGNPVELEAELLELTYNIHDELEDLAYLVDEANR